ncbi:helix-turn-helix domain-containing protein [Devosia sp.]|uniref:helix-turn-helix domain-containing protein n=1 Tax=Devosia sp. TaxID=1871048 RepID=UPI0025BE2C9B|nr:helix-turn-helix domain-containing protein [Devosia sp.]
MATIQMNELLTPTRQSDDHAPLALTLDQVIERSGIGRSMIFKAMREGKLRARKSGRRNIILYADLMKYLESLPVREVA